jgi:hypothetical protein
MRTSVRDDPSRAPDVSQPVELLTQRLVALATIALLCFNYPLIALWDHDALVFGIPLFPLALFVIWGLLIALLAWWMEGTQR